MNPTNTPIGSDPNALVDLAAIAANDAEIDPVILGPAKYTAQELADLTGWSVDQLHDLWLWSGTVPGNFDDCIFTETDAAGLHALTELSRTDNLNFDSVGTLVRSIAYAVERLALTQVESIVQYLAKQGLTDTEARQLAAKVAPAKNDIILQQIDSLWRRHYAAAIHRLTTETILLRGVSDDTEQFPLVVGVGYARIVDFTERTANFGVEEYASFVQTYHNSASDIINTTGGRVVKIMGDLIVWVTPNPETAAEIALHLAELSGADFAAQVQVGMTWCRVMTLHGDLFGPGVNLAAKLVEIAPPAGVLLDDAAARQFVRDARYGIASQPELHINGLGKVRPWLLTRA